MSEELHRTASLVGAAVQQQEGQLNAVLAGQAGLLVRLISAQEAADLPQAASAAVITRCVAAVSKANGLRNEMIRIHGELRELGTELGVGDTGKCPNEALVPFIGANLAG